VGLLMLSLEELYAIRAKKPGARKRKISIVVNAIFIYLPKFFNSIKIISNFYIL
jgi:hypothetical protein